MLSDALNTQGCAAAALGRDWIHLLRRALDIAVSERLHAQAGRAFTNICNIYVGERQFAAAEPYFTQGVAYCDERDITSYARCLRSDRIIALERTGRWSEALALSGELLSHPGASPINRLVPLQVIGLIRARRGEPGAGEYLDEAAGDANGTGEPQYIVPARLARAEAAWLNGNREAAVREAGLAADVAGRSEPWDRGAVAAWLRRTGSDRGCRGALAGPYRSQMNGDQRQAAQLWMRLGCPYEAALALLDAAGEEPSREALRIFTDLGAAAAAASPGRPCASSASGPSRPGRGPRRGRIRSG